MHKIKVNGRTGTMTFEDLVRSLKIPLSSAQISGLPIFGKIQFSLKYEDQNADIDPAVDMAFPSIKGAITAGYVVRIALCVQYDKRIRHLFLLDGFCKFCIEKRYSSDPLYLIQS
jgi:hypothetical protein